VAGVVFYVFKSPLPSAAGVVAGFRDFLAAAAMMDVMGIKLSLATLAALLYNNRLFRGHGYFA